MALILWAIFLPNAAFADDSSHYIFIPSPHALRTGQNASFLGFTQRVLPTADGSNAPVGSTVNTAVGVIDNEDCFFDAGLGYDDSYPAGRDRTIRPNVKFGVKGDGAWRPTFYAGTLFYSARPTYADQNLIYLSAGWVLENGGAFSLGGYVGHGGRLKDENGLQSNRGFLFGLEKNLFKIGDSNQLVVLSDMVTGQNEVGMFSAALKYKRGDRYFLLASYSWTLVKVFGSDFVQLGVGFSLF